MDDFDYTVPANSCCINYNKIKRSQATERKRIVFVKTEVCCIKRKFLGRMTVAFTCVFIVSFFYISTRARGLPYPRRIGLNCPFLILNLFNGGSQHVKVQMIKINGLQEK